MVHVQLGAVAVVVLEVDFVVVDFVAVFEFGSFLGVQVKRVLVVAISKQLAVAEFEAPCVIAFVL